MVSRASAFFCCLVSLLVSVAAYADDWPQWLGPQRDGILREQGIVEAIPADGLSQKWSAEVAHGYAGPAVADGKVFLFDYEIESGELFYRPGQRDKLTGEERLACLDAKTGKQLWRKSYPRDYTISYGGGPRCTPTVDGDRVYTLGAEGDLVCRRVADGQIIWQKRFAEEFGSVTPIWGYAAHPLVHGDLLYCIAGGEGSVAVAFDKMTGEVRWKNLSAGEPGYCPPTMITHAGQQQLLIWHPESLNAVEPATGKLIWSLPATPSYGMSLAQPQKLGDKIFISAIGNLSVLMQLNKDGSDVEVLWSGGPKDGINSVNVTPYLEPGVIYGVDSESSALTAVDMQDGSRLWETKQPTIGKSRGRHGTTFLTRHEPSGGYFLFSETGELITAKLSPTGYEETGRTQLLEPTGSTSGRPVLWSHPAYARKCIYVRNDKELVCVSLAK